MIKVHFSHRYAVYITSIMLLAGACNTKDGVKPQVKPLMEAVYASGYVVAKDEYEVYAQAEGYLTGKLVEEGDLVKQGDPMFVLDAGQPSARYRIARENYALARQNYQDDSPVLSELSAALETARTKKDFDSLNHVRYRNLLQEHATSQAEFDRAQLAYENSRNEYMLQKSRYAKTKNQLYLEFQNAKNQLDISLDERGNYTIRSRVDGMVFSTRKEQGELVRRNDIIAVVGRKDDYYLELSIDEMDVQRVREGQEVLVKIDAYPDKVFHAMVTKLYPMINKQQQSVQADATLKEPLPGWFSGLAVEANIIIQQKDKALVIPKAVLLPGDSVMIDDGKEKKKVKVRKGIETLEEVEIIGGLDTTMELVVNR